MSDFSYEITPKDGSIAEGISIKVLDLLVQCNAGILIYHLLNSVPHATLTCTWRALGVGRGCFSLTSLG
jgi:hypothetical protein